MATNIRFFLDLINIRKTYNHRLIIAWVLMMIALLTIIIRLIFLQIINHDNYTTLSENNRLKILPLPPIRGLIYDRNGILLAENRVSYNLNLIPEQVPDFEPTVQALSKIIAIDSNDLAQFQREIRQKRRFEAVPLRLHLTEDEVARFSVQSYRFPGIEISSSWSRYYPLGPRGVHAIGYVGRINEHELKVIDKHNYSGSNYIGKIGIEKFYENELHGKVGFQNVETNVQGRVLRVLERTAAVSGKNLYLNLDLSVQQFAEDLVKDQRAAIVAMEPNTGAIIVLVSSPAYDPNPFVNGIDADSYRLLRDSPDRPLFDRAIRGQYPPGSTIKPIVSLGGLEYGVRTEQSRTWCRGWYSLKGESHRYRDWKKSGHGAMNLHSAIEQSCDVYFYSLANDLGIDRLHAFMSRFGFGQKTNLDISGEAAGLMPSKEWKERTRHRAWFAGETLIVGIGQGFMLSTPLQLAVATATLSNSGVYRQPRLVFAIEDTNSNETSTLPFTKPAKITLKNQNFWQAAKTGMEAVTHSGRGTARRIGQRSPYRLAGKTGTAQVVGIKQDERYNARKLAKKFHDHAWFIAFAPVDNPKIAVAVIVENGGGGSQIAAPIAKKVMDFYLLPESREQLTTPAQEQGQKLPLKSKKIKKTKKTKKRRKKTT